MPFSFHGQRGSLVQVTYTTDPGISLSGKRLRYVSMVHHGIFDKINGHLTVKPQANTTFY